MEEINTFKNLSVLSMKLLDRLEIVNPATNKIELMESILSLIETTPIETIFDNQLSDQESECLFWLVNGATQSQIAKLMNIKRETVKEYQSRILRKLKGKTILQAVYKRLLSMFLKNEKTDSSKNI